MYHNNHGCIAVQRQVILSVSARYHDMEAIVTNFNDIMKLYQEASNPHGLLAQDWRFSFLKIDALGT